MTDRRFDDDEIAEIFRKAAEGPPALSGEAGSETGMTLSELQAIGREAGLSPEAVASAARSLEVRQRSAVRRYLSLPIGVERTIELDRQLTEAEWERLVVQLREVFNARGTVSSSGSLRQWTNGNLQALLEPTANGHRLRLLTTRGSARGWISFGSGLIGTGAVLAISAAIAGDFAAASSGVAMFSLFGASAIANGALRLPSWARRRARQMEMITSRVALETGPKAPDDKALP